MRKKLLIKRIDLLNIGLDSLIIKNTKVKKNITSEIIQNDIRNRKYDRKHSFELFIGFIYILQEVIEEQSLNQLAKEIIEIYNKSATKKTLEKYIIKFCYIYRNRKKYYIGHKMISSDMNKKTRIIKEAIKKIYIMTKLKNYKGIYILIKYLNH